MILDQPEVAIVGGGVAGSSLAAVLARLGIDVAVLEHDETYVDRVRGEYIAPWGVSELDELGLLDTILNGGGAYVRRIISYDENIQPEVAEANSRDLTAIYPKTGGAICISHPGLCTALNAAAAESGARTFHGVTAVSLLPGSPPNLSFQWHGHTVQWRPKLIVGADGRNSIVRRQAGIILQSDKPHNLLGGMLVDGVPEWPEDTYSFGTEGNFMYYVFPLGGGKLRLYAGYGYDSHRRFAGPERQQHLLEAFRLKCMPIGEKISRATPIGPFNSFPNEDHWTDNPFAEGIVLIGDAAGYNDPVGGQGLAIAFRDVRVLSTLMFDTHWSAQFLSLYANQRKEYMRRLRITCQLLAKLRIEFGEAARLRRAAVLQKVFMQKQLSPMMALICGPETLSEQAFEQQTIDALFRPA